MTSNTTRQSDSEFSPAEATLALPSDFFPLLFILQFPTIFNHMRFLLAILTEFLCGTFELGATSTVIAPVTIVVVAG